MPRPLAVTQDEQTLYCALSDLHGFVIAGLRQGKAVRTVRLPPLPPGVELPVAHTPTHGLELTPDGREPWVARCGTDTVNVFDAAGRKVLGKVGVGRGLNWVAFSRDGRYCCVSYVLSDDVSIIDLAGRKEVARVKVGRQPQAPGGRERAVKETAVRLHRGEAKPRRTTQGPDSGAGTEKRP